MFILIFASPLSVLWMTLANKKKEPSTPIKFSIGILLLSIGFLILGLAPRFISFETIAENDTILKIAAVPAILLVLSYLFQTLGELCLSPIGLSMVSRLAPTKIVGMVIGAWYLSSSLAFQIGGWIANLTTDESSYEITETNDSQEDFSDAISYTKVLETSSAQQALQTAIDKNYISEETLQTISDEEKCSVVNLLRYTDVFVKVGLAALLASILLFLLSPMIHRMMHEG